MGNICPSKKNPKEGLLIAIEYTEEAEVAVHCFKWQEALLLCQKALMHLTQAKKNTENTQSIERRLIKVYCLKGQSLQNQGEISEALLSYEEAKKLGANIDTYIQNLQEVSSTNTETLAFPLIFKNAKAKTLTDKEKNIATAIFPETVKELADLLSPPLYDPHSLLNQDLIDLARGIISIFADERVKSPALIEEVVTLASAQNPEIIHELLSKFTASLSIETKLLEPHLLKGLAEIIGTCNPQLLKSDDLVQILDVLILQITKSHRQFKKEENNRSHIEILESLSTLLEAMADVGISGLAKQSRHEALYEALSPYLESNTSLAFLAHYCRQSLIRIPNDESAWKGFLRRFIEGGKGIFSIAMAVSQMDPSLLINAYTNFVSAAKSQEKEESWYEDLRCAKLLLDASFYPLFESWVKEKAIKNDERFLLGVFHLLEKCILNSEEEQIKTLATELLKQYEENAFYWTKQITKKNLCKDANALKLYLFQKIEDISSLPVKNSPSSSLPSFSRLIGAARLSPLYQTSLGGLLEIYRKSILTNEEISQDLELYTPSLGIKSTEDNEPFDLMGDVQEFLAHKEQKVLLLLASSGMGKSFFARFLERKIWDERASNVIPLFISLTTHMYEKNLIENVLSSLGFNQEQVKQLKKNYKFVFLIDGYDEVHGKTNLYKQHNLHEWQAKTVILCRREYLLGENYQLRFIPFAGEKRQPEALRERFLAPFTEKQIGTYLENYTKYRVSKWKDPEQYKKAIYSVPGLKEMITNPYILSMATEVLPTLPDLTVRITRIELYESFLNQWITKQVDRLVGQTQIIEAFGEEPLDEVLSWLKKLADLMFREKIYPAYYDETHKESLPLKPFFITDSKKINVIRLCCPFRKEGANKYGFIHKSLWELLVYLVGLKALEDGSYLEEDSLFNKCSLTTERGILHFFAEKIESDTQLQEKLFSLLLKSKNNPSFAIASANAITILNAAKVSFSGRDLSGVQVPGADLTYGIFDQTNFEGADLSFVAFRGAWLKNAHLANAQLEGISFGEFPYLPITEVVKSSHVSSDGQWMSVVGQSKIWIYHLADRTLEATLEQQAEEAWVLSQNKKTAFLLQNRSLGFWDSATGELTHADPKLYHQYGSEGTFDPSAQFFISAMGGITLWDVTTNQSSSILGNGSQVYSVVFNSDGTFLALGTKNGEILLWDRAKKFSEKPLKSHTQAVLTVIFNTSNALLASGGEDKTVKIWNAQSRVLEKTLKGHQEAVLSLAFNPSGKQLASSSRDKTIRIWSIETGQTEIILEGHTQPVTNISFDLSGKQLASIGASIDRRLRFWDLSLANAEKKPEESSFIQCAEINSSSTKIASIDSDGLISICNAQTGKVERSFQGSKKEPRDLVFIPLKEELIVLDKEGKLYLWDINTGQLKKTLAENEESITSLTCEEDGNTIAFANKKVTLWDKEKDELKQTFEGHTAPVYSLLFNASRKELFSGGEDKIINVWDVESGKLKASLIGHKNCINALILSDSKEKLLSASSDGSIRIWDIASSSVERVIQVDKQPVRSLIFDPSGKYLISASWDGLISFWDTRSWKLKEVVRGHTHSLKKIFFDHKSGLLVSIGLDNAMRYWQIKEKSDNSLSIVLKKATTQKVLTLSGIGLSGSNGLTKENALLATQADEWQVSSLKKLLKEPQDIETLKGGLTPIAFAASHRLIDELKELLLKGAGCNGSMNNQGITPLICAAQNGHLNCLEALINHPGIEVNKPDENGWTALMFAAENNHLDCLKKLLETQAEPNLKEKTGLSALHLATRSGHFGCCKELIAKGAIVDIESNDGIAPLNNAAQYGHLDCLKELIANGANVDLQRQYGSTALMTAAKFGHIGCVKELLAHGANPNLQNKGGWTALMVTRGNLDCFKALIEGGADLNIKNESSDGNTTLMVVAWNSYIDCAKELIAKGVDVNTKNKYGATVLSWIRNLALAKVLIEAGAIIDNVDNKGNTPLINAATRELLEIMHLLLDNKADINHQNKKGETALITAVETNRIKSIKELLERGALLDSQTTEGKTALMIAQELNNKEAIELIEKASNEQLILQV